MTVIILREKVKTDKNFFIDSQNCLNNIDLCQNLDFFLCHNFNLVYHNFGFLSHNYDKS